MTDKRIKSYLEDRLKRLESIRYEREWTTSELGDITCCKQTLAFIDSLQEEPKSDWLQELHGKLDSMSKEELQEVFKKYEKACNLKEKPISDEFEKIVEEIAEPTILNAYGTKELARRLRNTICGTSVSEDLEETAKRYALNNTPWDDCDDEIQDAFIEGAQWQKEQLMKDAIEASVEIDAGGYPYINRTIEMYDYDRDQPLAKKAIK